MKDINSLSHTSYRCNYTNQLISTSKGTLSGTYLDGVYDGQIVKKFYNRNYFVSK